MNAQNQNGDTAVHKAVWRHHADACQVLVDAGADVEIANHDNKTPLAIARDANIKRIGLSLLLLFIIIIICLFLLCLLIFIFFFLVAPPFEMAEDDECDEDSD